MAYTRFGTSDAYMLKTISGHLECLSCRLLPNEQGWYDSFCTVSPSEFYSHVLDHLRVGHTISPNGRRRIRKAAKADGWKPRKKVVKK